MRPLRLDRIKNWIFVTGVIRSGTTFVGKVLSLPLEVDYIHEPFNGGRTRPKGELLQACYIRPGVESEATRRLQNQLEKLLALEIDLNTSITPLDPWWIKSVKKVLGSRGPLNLRLARLNPFHTSVVIKDPVGSLLAEYLYLHYDIVPVVVVRHPLSFLASLQRVGWWPDINGFAGQPDLLADYFPGEEAWFDTDWSSLRAQSAARWRASYKVLLSQAQRYPDWVVVTHESICAKPLESFRELYRRLSLPWSASVERRIRKLTQGKTLRSRSGRAMDLKRDSAAISRESKTELSVEDRREIFDIVKDVALELYDVESFGLEAQSA